MFASYVISRTVSPLCCSRFLRPHGEDRRVSRWLLGLVFVLALLLTGLGGMVWLAGTGSLPWLDLSRLGPRVVVWLSWGGVAATIGGGAVLAVLLLFLVAPVFERLFELFARLYERVLGFVLRWRICVVAVLAALAVLAIIPFKNLGQELFPEVDASEFTIHMRVTGGPRVEETERQVEEVENLVREVVRPEDLGVILANVGISSRWSAIYTPNNGPHAAFVRVQLRSGFAGRERTTLDYVNELRGRLAERFPGNDFLFETGGMIRRILNAGAMAPVEVQVHSRDFEARRHIARELDTRIMRLPQVLETYQPQGIDLPQLRIEVNRERARLVNLTETDVVRNVIIALMSSAQIAPNFWIDPRSGNPYFVGVQFPEDAVEGLQTLETIPITPERGSLDGIPFKPRQLKEVADIHRTQAPVEIFRQNADEVSQVLVSVGDNDLAGVAGDIERIVKDLELPPGMRVTVRGEVQSMRDSFGQMAFALGLAVLLVYLVMAAQFSSWLDPLIMIVAAPLGLIGVVSILWLTNSSLNIQSLMGVLMMVGISVSNSVLLVEFANRQRQAGLDPLSAALSAARTRLRPILMTTVATILGLLPMAIHLRPGDEMNLPLARAVIGGLAGSTILTLFVVPVLYTLFKRGQVANGQYAIENGQ
jgi:multidrug efflux pump subunit AcrB